MKYDCMNATTDNERNIKNKERGLHVQNYRNSSVQINYM